MIFGHDSLGINNHVFQSDYESANETTYEGETIIQRFHDFQTEGGVIPKVRYSLTTTVFGTTYEKTITRNDIYLSVARAKVEEDIETQKAEAEKFIDDFHFLLFYTFELLLKFECFRFSLNTLRIFHNHLCSQVRWNTLIMLSLCFIFFMSC